MAVKSTIGETRAVRFLKAAENNCRLPVLLQYCGAHTTRWSAGNKMNMQNLKRGGELRKSIKAPPGYVLVVIDSAQIEARTNLWLAGDEPKLQIFRDYDAGVGPDLYKVMAAQIYNKPVNEVTKDERQLGKICVLALGYGMGAVKLQDTLATDPFNPVQLGLAECQRIVNIYRDFNQPITGLWKQMEALLPYMIHGEKIQYKAIGIDDKKMLLPSGLAIHYDGLTGFWSEWTNRYVDCSYTNARNVTTKLYGGLLTENAVQALARCIVADQMLSISKRYRVVMMTHDEVVYLAPEAEAEEALAFGLEIMKTPPDWAADLPINAEGAYAKNYSK
jgi:DNA polymerase